MPKPSETDIKRACLELLKLRGILAWRNHSGKVKVKRGFMCLAPEGSPDIVGIAPGGRFLGIEVKKPGHSKHAEHEERQRQFHADIERRGGVAFLVQDAIELDQKLKAWAEQSCESALMRWRHSIESPEEKP